MGHYSEDYDDQRTQEQERVRKSANEQHDLLQKVVYKLELPDYYKYKINDVLNYLKARSLK